MTMQNNYVEMLNMTGNQSLISGEKENMIVFEETPDPKHLIKDI